MHEDNKGDDENIGCILYTSSFATVYQYDTNDSVRYMDKTMIYSYVFNFEILKNIYLILIHLLCVIYKPILLS